jgi:cytosine/adenosine deaminase-related metal-dependent hydrolase
MKRSMPGSARLTGTPKDRPPSCPASILIGSTPHQASYRLTVARGTAHLRTHVDIDLESRLLKRDGVLAARERYRGLVSVQIVALPQSGVMRCPGVLDLLDAAVRDGADLVGGIDPLEIDRDLKSLPLA